MVSACLHDLHSDKARFCSFRYTWISLHAWIHALSIFVTPGPLLASHSETEVRRVHRCSEIFVFLKQCNEFSDSDAGVHLSTYFVTSRHAGVNFVTFDFVTSIFVSWGELLRLKAFQNIQAHAQRSTRRREQVRGGL